VSDSAVTLNPQMENPNLSVEALYDQMLIDVAAANARFPEKEVMVSFAQLGRNYNRQLMVVGRAVFGGDDEDSCTPECWDSGETRRAYLDRAKKKADEDPLQWVIDSFKARKGENGENLYNSRKSAFWRVIRHVMSDLDLVEKQSQWSTELVWTNLYKVAPLAPGNPSGRLQKAERRACVEILRLQIDVYAPRRLLFLTGADWFNPFGDALGFSDQGRIGGKFVQRIGKIAAAESMSHVVVARHPQGKPEAAFVAEVTSAFSRLESEN
jgi:hypothetical protein